MKRYASRIAFGLLLGGFLFVGALATQVLSASP